MKVTERTRRALASRRQAKRLEAAGYRRHETDWEIVRGGRWREVIVAVEIDVGGQHVWTKLGELRATPCVHDLDRPDKTLKAVIGEPFVGFYCTACNERWGFRQ